MQPPSPHRPATPAPLDQTLSLRPSLHRDLGNRGVQRIAGAANMARPAFEAPQIVHDVLRAPGQPLDPGTRTLMESRFSADFGRVRVHADDRAAESADVLRARAYTVGRDVVFGARGYAPSSRSGRELLAHELAHTIQQRDANARPPSADPRGTVESTADTAARDVVSGQTVSSALPACGVGLSLAPAPPGKSPVLDPRKRTWRRYAHSEGQKDAARIRQRGQLSTEDRQEINAKLSFFEGQAYDVYVRAIKPALSHATGADHIEVPETSQSYVGALPTAQAADFMRRREHTLRYFRKKSDVALERHYRLVLHDVLTGDTRWDLDTLEQIIQSRAPGAAWHERERQEFLENVRAQGEAREREKVLAQSPDYWKTQMGALEEQIQKWPKEIQDLARNLLWKWFELRKKANPAGPEWAIPAVEASIETTIRRELVSQFEQVLRAAEKYVRAECEKKPPDWMMKFHGDPCKPWFESAYGRGTSALHYFESRLMIFRDEDGVPYRTVVYWIEEYLKQPVPTSMAGRYLELLQARSMLTNALLLSVRPMKNLPVPPPVPPVAAAAAKPIPALAATAPAVSPVAPAAGATRRYPSVDVTKGGGAFVATPAKPPVSAPPRAVTPPAGTPARISPAAAPRPSTAPVVAGAPASSAPAAAGRPASGPPLSLWQRLFRDRWLAGIIRGLELSEGVQKIGAGGRAKPAITAKATPSPPAPTPTPVPGTRVSVQTARPVGRSAPSAARSRPTTPAATEASARVTPTSPAVSTANGGTIAPGTSLRAVTAARGAANIATTQGTAFTQPQILELFIRYFKRPGPPEGTIVFHPTEESFQAAVQAAGLPAGTLAFFAHPTQEGAAPGTPGAMGLIHLPPDVSTLVTIHESLHMIGYQSGVIAILGQFVEEGLTEWLARSLGPQTVRGLYDSNVAFVKLLAGVVGEDTLRNAYLHRRWAPLRAALRTRLGGDAAVEHFYRLLRQVGPYGQRGGVLEEAIDMLWPGSSAESGARQAAGPRTPGAAPAAVAPRGSQPRGVVTSSAAAPRGPRTPEGDRAEALQGIEQAIAAETESLRPAGSRPLNPETSRPVGEQVLTAQSQERARQQWEQALLPLASEPQGGTIGEIHVENVYFNSVQVSRNGDELLVGYFGVRRDSAPGGAATEVHEALEKAAFAVARQVGARSVRVFARTVVNAKWRAFLLGRRYTAHQMPHATGFESVLAKRFPVPRDMLTIGEDRLRQSPPPVPAQWPDPQTFGVQGIRWGSGVAGANKRMLELKQTRRTKAIQQLQQAGVTLGIAEKWRFHYYFEYYVAGAPNPTAKAREELMTYIVELLSGQ